MPVVVDPDTLAIVEMRDDIPPDQMNMAINMMDKAGYHIEAQIADNPPWTHLVRLDEMGTRWIWWLVAAAPD